MTNAPVYSTYTGAVYDAGSTHTSPLPAHTHNTSSFYGYVQSPPLPQQYATATGTNTWITATGVTVTAQRGLDPWDILEMATMPWINAKISDSLVEQALWAVENGQALI